MSVKRTLTLGGAAGVLIVWLAAAGTSTSRPAAPVAPFTPSVVDRSGAELASEIARLRARLHPGALPAQTRDVFRYEAQGARRVGADVAASALSQTTAVTPAAVAPEPFKIVGMTEDAGAAGPVRSAILSGAGDLFIVQEGDRVASRYRVSKIDTDFVELVDIVTETPLHIAVK